MAWLGTFVVDSRYSLRNIKITKIQDTRYKIRKYKSHLTLQIDCTVNEKSTGNHIKEEKEKRSTYRFHGPHIIMAS